MRQFRFVFLMLLAIAVPGLATAQSDSLDAPLKKEVVDLGPSPYTSGSTTLACYRYRTFMVKEYSDPGLKGAEWLAIVPFQERDLPLCTKAHGANERVIEDPEWRGYYRGAKGDLVIFHAEDGTDGGMPFVVYDAKTGKQLFHDSYFYAAMWTKKFPHSPFNDLRVNLTPGGQAILKYLRVDEADCDLHLEKAACWAKVKKKLALKSTPMPVCSGYKGITTRYESAVAYPVEVSLFPKPSTKTVDGPAKCWPVD